MSNDEFKAAVAAIVAAPHSGTTGKNFRKNVPFTREMLEVLDQIGLRRKYRPGGNASHVPRAALIREAVAAWLPLEIERLEAAEAAASGAGGEAEA